MITTETIKALVNDNKLEAANELTTDQFILIEIARDIRKMRSDVGLLTNILVIGDLLAVIGVILYLFVL